MKNYIDIGTILTVSLALGACASQSRLEDILNEIFPAGAQFEVASTCSNFLGSSVGLFSVSSLPSEKSILDHMVDGHWVRSNSLLQFAETTDQEYVGAGVSATVLDGKECLLYNSDQAEEILFGNKSGLYFRSKNREIVAILFDDPQGQGVLFLQAP